MKDYFWINDMHPRMVIHPYRTDLNGQDLSDYTDPEGKRVFVDFVDLVKRQGAGYMQYMWQWKDNKGRILPKLSYVKGFTPWGWIIGTGIYIDDVQAEIKAITRNLFEISLFILLIIALLLASIIRQSYHHASGSSSWQSRPCAIQKKNTAPLSNRRAKACSWPLKAPTCTPIRQ